MAAVIFENSNSNSPAWFPTCCFKNLAKNGGGKRTKDLVHPSQNWMVSLHWEFFHTSSNSMLVQMNWYTGNNYRFLKFLPLWILRCLFKLIDCAYDLEHCKHLYGFSPVWTLICWFKWHERANDLVHSKQL